MKLKPSIVLIIGASCAAAVFIWSLAQSGNLKAVALADRRVAGSDHTSLEFAGTIVPAISTPIVGQHLDLTVPRYTPVKRGDVIGTEAPQANSGDVEEASQELEAAMSAWKAAEENVRSVERDLETIQSQSADLNRQEAQAEAAEFDVEREFERRDDLFRAGLSSRFDHSGATSARASAEAAVDSIRSNLSESSVEIDVLKAKAEAAQAELRDATSRRDAARAALDQVREGPHARLIVAPADGVLVASDQPGGATLGIVSDLQQLVAYAMIPSSDLMDIRVGQQALIVLDKDPSATFHGHVSAISETPVDLLEGVFYQVTFAVDNPEGACLSNAAVHARVVRSAR